MIKKRNIALSILLVFITCGIYIFIWFINLTDDVRNASDDDSLPSGGVAFLLSLITLGIYTYYWAYKMGKSLVRAANKNGINDDDYSVLYLVLQVLGLGIINFCLIQNTLNKIATKEK